MTNHASRAVNPASETRFRARRSPAAVAFASVLLLLPNLAWAADFKAGPAVRVVIPNTKVEIRWIAPFVGNGRVDVFDDPTGSPDHLVYVGTSSSAIDHTIDVFVGGVIAPDTTYYFRVTHSDPTGIRSDLTNDPAPYPPFFTGTEPPSADPVQPKLSAADGAANPFSVSVAVSGDIVVVGTPSAGVAYVFVKPDGGWATTKTPAATLTASDGAAFAHPVAIDGDTVVVVAPGSSAAYVFVKPENGWAGNLSETAKLNASAPAFGFGSSVAIDGDTVVVGAEQDDTFKGAAFVFMKPAGGWTGNVSEIAKLTASDGEPGSGAHPGDRFGHSVAISGDTVVVGAYEDSYADSLGQGSAYVFVKPAGGWGDTSAFAAKLTASDGQRFGQFGFSVAISGDALVVGARALSGGQDAAYVFVKPAGGWAGNLIESAKLTASDVAFLDFLGHSVAIRGDTVLIGAPGNEGAKGAAYVFLKPAEGWAGNLNEAVKLTASDGETFDFLGSSVAISGDTLVVGAAEWGDFQASAYVFTSPTAPTDSTAPTISLTTPPDGAVYAQYQVVNADYGCQDEAGGSGLASCVGTLANGAAVNTDTVGTKTFTVTATDTAGNSSSLSHTYSVIYTFSGLFAPVNNLPTLNRMKAGAAAPVKFSLAGYQGLGIFAAGYPSSVWMACDSTALVDGVEQTLTAGSSSLSYDPNADVYTYVWKTEKSWSGTCRQLVLKLNDGTFHRANFRFE